MNRIKEQLSADLVQDHEFIYPFYRLLEGIELMYV